MGDGEPDLLSELPDELISHILSFLPVEDATGAKLLSRRWRHLYPDNPILEFYFDAAPGGDEPDPNIRMAMFVAWVDKYLRQFIAPKIAAFKLFLALELVKEYAGKVDEWIRVACRMKARSIVLCIESRDSYDDSYIFPFHLLSTGDLSHLRHLSLQGCYLPPFTALNGPITSLRELELLAVSFSDSSGNFDDIASYCPNLESLQFLYCHELPSMRHLCGQLYYLKALKLSYCSGSRDFEIHDVNLIKMTYAGRIGSALDISFKGLNCLQSLFISASLSQKEVALLLSTLPKAAPQLESLRLSLDSWTKEDFRYPAFASTFKCLKYLQLLLWDADVENLSKILQTAPLLQKLEISFSKLGSEKWSPISFKEQLQKMHNRHLQSQPLQHSLLKEIEISRTPYLERNFFEIAVFLLISVTSLEKMTLGNVERENHERLQGALVQYKKEVNLKS